VRRLIFALGICSLIVVAVGAFYGAWMVHHGFSTRTPPGALESFAAESMRDLAVPSRYKSMKNPVTATPDALREGMEHWADHCATCHANNGSGDTMYGKTLYPRPPDMRQKDTQEMSDGELYYTIQNGIMLSGMPAFGAPGDDDQDSWKLVAFIRHLPSLSQSEESEMGKMNPKSPDELEEEHQEENFLQGSPANAQPSPTHQHGKEPR
jgi:mono/diheme cytochrome c family protein